MPAHPPAWLDLTRESPVIQWLLDSDPALRWQVFADLLDAPTEAITERVRIATEGWGAQLLDLQDEGGTWGGTAFNQGYNSTMHVLMLLRDLGISQADERMRRALKLVNERVIWDYWNTRFFEGETEPCINGQVGAAGAYMGQDVQGIIDRLLNEQLGDGGWNCEAENGATRSSFNTTICVLEALLAYELANRASAPFTEARERGQEYLLERRLFRRKSTGEVIEADRKRGGVSFLRFAFPTWWHYDVLRGLEYFRRADTRDQRLADGIALVESKRTPDGRWLLDTRYPGVMPVDLGESEGAPSKWNTLRALRVLKWYYLADA